jgi:microcystin-dependent protein
MAFTTDDFNKIWASASPLTPYEFSDSNYAQGWNFIGSTPPARQMWDYLQKLTDEKIKYIYNNMIPCGIVQAYAGNTVPDGWLLCNGSAVSRTDYAELYSVIGDTYGAGDGSTTFNLPNLVDKFVEGSATSGTVKGAGLPNIQGSLAVGVVGASTWDVRTATGAFSTPSATSAQRLKSPGMDTRTASGQIAFSASDSNSIYGNSTTVQPPALTMLYIIKY